MVVKHVRSNQVSLKYEVEQVELVSLNYNANLCLPNLLLCSPCSQHILLHLARARLWKFVNDYNLQAESVPHIPHTATPIRLGKNALYITMETHLLWNHKTRHPAFFFAPFEKCGRR